MKRAPLARLIGTMCLALPAAVFATPSDASACGSALYLARRPPDPQPVVVAKPVEAPKPAEAAKPSELIIPPFTTQPATIKPRSPAPRVRPRLPPPPVTVDRPLLVAQAEQALSEGKPAKAAALVATAFPALRHVAPGSLMEADRALRVLALASVRSDGRLDAAGLHAGSADERTANLFWAADVLSGLNAHRANNPSYQTDLGEALAKLPDRRDDAVKLLGALADKDLVTSAEGYAALARLRSEPGDEAARLALIKRCESMTKLPGVCAVPDPSRQS